MPAPLPPPVGSCPECSDPETYLYDWDGRPVCAHCYRVLSAPHRYDRTQLCDRCSAPHAFRNPEHRVNEYLCPDCHAEDGYVLGDSAMLSKLSRIGKTHSRGRRDTCIAAGPTPCGGQTKQRGSLGVLCTKHFDPIRYEAVR